MGIIRKVIFWRQFILGGNGPGDNCLREIIQGGIVQSPLLLNLAIQKCFGISIKCKSKMSRITSVIVQ